MKLTFFAVPALDPGTAAAALAAFLGHQRVVAVDRQLVQDGAASFWAVCVTTTGEAPGEGAGRGERSAPGRKGEEVDYKEVLTPEQFATYARLRDLRKQLAAAEGTPAYALFTNAQLAQMVTDRATTLEALRALPGVGNARVDKFGAAFLDILRGTAAEGG